MKIFFADSTVQVLGKSVIEMSLRQMSCIGRPGASGRMDNPDFVFGQTGFQQLAQAVDLTTKKYDAVYMSGPARIGCGIARNNPRAAWHRLQPQSNLLSGKGSQHAAIGPKLPVTGYRFA